MGKKIIIKGADFSANGIAPEFQKLKCIISASSTQTMRSPISMPAIGRVVIDMAVSLTGSIYNLFGYLTNTTTHPEEQMYLSAVYGASPYYSGGFGMLGYINKSGAQVTTDVIKDKARHTIDFSRYALKVDGTSIAISQSPSTQNSVPFGIFGVASYLGVNSDAIGRSVKLYGVKMYSDYQNEDSLILDAIPVKRLSDNKICLYDKISGEYIYTKDETNPDYEELD